MDCRAVVLCCLAVLLTLLITIAESRNKKVVIHVPYKVKKIMHTHTLYKTIHHHHHPPQEEHEHFHHMHIHDEPSSGQHSQPIPGVGIPEFLPDVPINLPLDIPDVPVDIPGIPNRHLIPLFRRA